jgi:Fe-S oxidoreductase
MEQNELRELEATCIQEERAQCIAACPIHVDVKSMMACIAKGDIKGARKILDRTMPFPEILGRTCDQPCLESCVRSNAGGSLCIGSIERFCIENSTEAIKPPKLPAKDGKIAIIGCGLSSMTAALDLARKGRNSTIFTGDSFPGGPLNNLPESILPEETLTKAVGLLESLGVVLEKEKNIDADEFRSIVDNFDAVIIELDFRGIEDFNIDIEKIDEVTLQIEDKIFATGQKLSDKFSPMSQAASGRRACSSVDRFLQNASLTSRREKEGPYETRLYTSIEGVEDIIPVLPSASVYTEEEARQEALRCLLCECMECVKHCEFLQYYKEYPKRYIRKVYNNQAIVTGTRQSNKMINSCSLCGQCEVICPNDFSMANVCLDARRYMIGKNHMPPSAHEFALLDMEFSRGEHFSMLKHEQGKDSSEYLFFPGCQLSGSDPEVVEKLYGHLCSTLSGGVGLMLDCCGIPAHWAGRQSDYDAIKAELMEKISDMGSPVIITACATCYDSFSREFPEFKTVSIWEILDAEGLPDTKSDMPAQTFSISDPCTARHHRGVQDAVRNVAAKLGFELEEPSNTREMTDCCGFGGLMFNANPDLADKTAKRKAERTENDILAYCAMCRDNLVASGKKTAHLLEYIFPDENQKIDPLERPNPGFSMRQENRSRLKNNLLEKIWKEEPITMPEYSSVKLIISDEVRDLLEKRRILDQDIQKTILACENSGRKLCNPNDEYILASHRPVRVTYWVEYKPVDGGYEIRNAYSHRMILPEDYND